MGKKKARKKNTGRSESTSDNTAISERVALAQRKLREINTALETHTREIQAKGTSSAVAPSTPAPPPTGSAVNGSDTPSLSIQLHFKSSATPQTRSSVSYGSELETVGDLLTAIAAQDGERFIDSQALQAYVQTRQGMLFVERSVLLKKIKSALHIRDRPDAVEMWNDASWRSGGFNDLVKAALLAKRTAQKWRSEARQ